MTNPRRVLILGASYGSLFATKLNMAGHSVQLVCLPEEAALINSAGTRVRFPVRGREGLIEVDSRRLPGHLSATIPTEVDPSDFNLVALAMQEPQYRAPEVRELLARIAESERPCMSIMNMPPLTYLKRIPDLNTEELRNCYADASVWDLLEPKLMTLASPDPQAFRPSEDEPNVLQVSLPTNFKVARFESDEHTGMLRSLQADIEATTYDVAGEDIALPVKLKVHDSIFVPLAKWSMLLTGNYRCVQTGGMRSIRDAVHDDLGASRQIYDWVRALCESIGADPSDLVPFEKYANAANGLAKPSSAARALAAGAQNIERVDRLVQTLAASKGKRLAAIDEIVDRVETWLARNREVA